MTSTDTTKRSHDTVSISDLSFWDSTPEAREKTFQILRDSAPISWQKPFQGGMAVPETDGFWVLTRHADIVEVSKRSDVFVSGKGVMLEEVPEDIQFASASFLAMDAPRHTLLRKLVSSAFTPRQIARIQERVQAQAVTIVDELIDRGDCDFVANVSTRLPMWSIYEMVGLSPTQREIAVEHADGLVGWNDDTLLAGREPGELMAGSLIALLQIGMEFAQFRREHPAEDLMTNLVTAEVEGQRLTDEEIGSLFVLLSVAGNDTTRHTTSFAMKALCDFPDQRRLLVEDFDGRIGTAVEEFTRWASPVMTFRRTAFRDTVLAGQPIAAGEWVAMVYASGNRDERIFERPNEFDITREHNPHIGFGGGGPHFCMGSFLAKMQMRAIFGQLLHRVPTLEVGEPTYLIGNFIQGIKTLPCSF